MGLLENEITLIDAVSAPINSILNAVNSMINVFHQAQGALNNAFDPAEILNAQRAVIAANDALERFRQTGQNTQFRWQSDSGIEVFQTSGIERYRQELAGVKALMGQLANAEGRLAAHAQYGNILPEGAANDIILVERRISAIQQKIQRLSARPFQMVSPAENARLEQLRTQLNNAVQLQNRMNAAVENMDVEGANRAYLQLSQTVGNTERYIRDNISGQSGFNETIRQGQSEGNKLFEAIKKAAGEYLGISGLKKAMDLSDTLTSSTARLDMMNDGLQSTEDLQKMIFASAERARGSYIGTADAVAKLGNNAGGAFNSTGEIVAFMEQINKHFVIAGTEASGVQSAMLQITQAMGSGVLSGEEFNSILEQAPNIIQTIADYMGVPKGALKNMASEGQITADIVKNAMFASADKTNEKLENMPKTFSQIWTSFRNNALMAFQPVLEKMNEIANNQRVQEGISAVLDVLAVLADVALNVLGMIADAAGLIADNWSIIGPIVGAAALAFAMYEGVLLGVKGAALVTKAAQSQLNGSLFACPIFWIIGGLIAFIGIIAVATNAINSAYGLTLSFGGMLGGSIMTILAALGNIVITIYNIVVEVIIGVWNFIADYANYLANVFNDPLGAVVRLFVGVFDSILQMIEIVAGAIGNLFGQDWSSGIQDFRDKMNTAVEQQFGTGVEIVPKLGEKAWSFDYINYDDAFGAGYYIGDELGKKFSGANYTNDINNALNSNYPLDNLDKISDNTDKIANTLEMTGEDLKYLRDLAEQEVVNRFTTAEISVSLGGITNNISSNVDLDGIVDYIETGMFEAAERVAEGVH